MPERGRAMARVECRVQGIYPATGAPIDQRLRLTVAHDPSDGFYYWGTFQPRNCAPDPYQLSLRVEASDRSAHLAGRDGDQIDADPSTLAIVDHSDPSYRWLDYSPGPDLHHALVVSAATWRLDIDPQPQLVDPRAQARSTSTLAMRERHVDCQLEPVWGLTSCPVEWRLDPLVFDGTGHRLRPASLGLAIEFDVRRERTAVVTVDVPDYEHSLESGRYRPGNYSLHVDYTIGEGANRQSATAALDLALV